MNAYEEAIEKLNHQIEQQMEPYREVADRLQSCPAIKQKTAEVLIAEIGVDMSQFPSDAHLSSWAGVCPGNNERAGKRKSGRTNPGNTWLKGVFTEAAWAASRAKGTYLKARYQRLATRRGKKRAILAVEHTILVMAYHMIKEQRTYTELGADYFDRLHEQHLLNRLTARIAALGYVVEIKKPATAA